MLLPLLFPSFPCRKKSDIPDRSSTAADRIEQEIPKRTAGGIITEGFLFSEQKRIQRGKNGVNFGNGTAA